MLDGTGALRSYSDLRAISRSAWCHEDAQLAEGGLVVATALTLVFVPALYATWFRVRRDSDAPALHVAAVATPA